MQLWTPLTTLVLILQISNANICSHLNLIIEFWIGLPDIFQENRGHPRVDRMVSLVLRICMHIKNHYRTSYKAKKSLKLEYEQQKKSSLKIAFLLQTFKRFGI